MADGRVFFVGAVVAGVIAVLGAVPASAGTFDPTGTTPAQDAAPVTTLPGGAVPQVAVSDPVGDTSATARQNSVVFLKARNPKLLQRRAMAGSAGSSISPAAIQRLFMPTTGQVNRVVAYLESHGLTVTDRNLLSLDVSGTAAQQESAFGVDLGLYRTSSGHVFKAPDSSPRLPTSIASLVQAVGGLDSSMTMHPAGSGSSVSPAAVPVASCTGAKRAHSAYSGTLYPSELGSSGGYNHNQLVSSGNDGTNESIAMVEFSNYSAADISTYKSCFGITSPAPVQKLVHGGTSDRSGAGEVELDIEAAISAAPAARTYVYMAPNNVAYAVDMINQMVADQASTHVRIVSDSWGLCEPVMSPAIISAENTALQLAAAAGMSFYVATGDNGSSGCENANGSTALAAVDPATQPFATAVGGTRLRTTPSRNEVAWREGGGGPSMYFPKPSWQANHTVTLPNGGLRCKNPSGQCRQIPDISLNASPNTGYLIYCTVSAGVCGGLVGWLPIGGTSGAAPLMAGITADVNEYSLAHGGPRLGYANPFLYASSTIASGSFHDITSGGNNTHGGSSYNAGPGYDLATGLGSVNAMTLAQTLANNGSPATNPLHSSKLTVATPLANKSFVYGQRITFSGTLTDTTSSTPIAKALITVVIGSTKLRATTNANGAWAVASTTAVKRNTTWRAWYTGSAGRRAAPGTTPRKLMIVPRLTTASSLPFSGGSYRGHANVSFTLKGTSTPNMSRAVVVVQSRSPAGGSWHTLYQRTVGTSGAYSISMKHASPGSTVLRWFYKGSPTQRWMSSGSPARLFHFS